MDTLMAAHGRWREILPALGVPTGILSGKHQPCPMCGGKDRFRFDDKHGEGGYFCSGCGPGRGLQFLMRFHHWDGKRAVREIDQIIGNLPPCSVRATSNETQPVNPVSLRSLYAASQPVEPGDPVEQYLLARGLIDQNSKALRYVPKMKHRPTGTTHPGMIATFTGLDDRPATIHRTYLGVGRKADISPGRMFVPGRVSAGGAIRLWPVDQVMGIAEGIETALSARQMFGVPVWATTSAVMLEKWQPPRDVKRIVVYSDNDLNFAGQTAAYALAKRLVFEAARDKIERVVEVKIPPEAGDDWNDVLMQRSK